MAEIIEEPSALSKIIPVSFKINDTDSVATTRLATKKQFNTTDTDAWLSFTLDGIDANMTGEFDLTMVNVDENPSSIINRTNLPFSAIPFHYKIDASADVEKNQIRHAGRWIGQVIIRLANGDTTTRQFDFAIVGHLLDGKEARLILIEDYNALMATISESKQALDQYNVDYAALLDDITDAEVLRVQEYNALLAAQQANIEAFDVALDQGIVAENLAEKLQNFEATNNSRLLSAERQLEQAETQLKNAPYLYQAMGRAFDSNDPTLVDHDTHASWAYSNVHWDAKINKVVVFYTIKPVHALTNVRLLMRHMDTDYNFTLPTVVADGRASNLALRSQGSAILNNGDYIVLVSRMNNTTSEQLGCDVYKSADSGVTWTITEILIGGQPIKGTDGDINGCIVLASGRVISYLKEYGTNIARFLYSDDNGTTWAFASWTSGTWWDYSEPAFVELTNGTIICYLRPNGGGQPGDATPEKAIFTKSLDGGLTWSNPVQSTSITDFTQGNGQLLLDKSAGRVEFLHYSRHKKVDNMSSIYQSIASEADAENDNFGQPNRIIRFNRTDSYEGKIGDGGYVGACFLPDKSVIGFYYTGDKTKANICYFVGKKGAKQSVDYNIDEVYGLRTNFVKTTDLDYLLNTNISTKSANIIPFDALSWRQGTDAAKIGSPQSLTEDANRLTLVFGIDIKPNTRYELKNNTQTHQIAVREYNSSFVAISDSKFVDGVYRFTSNSNVKYVRFIVRRKDDVDLTPTDLSNLPITSFTFNAYTPLAEKKYLYSEGKEKAWLTGGWAIGIATGVGTAVKNADNMQASFNLAAANPGKQGFITVNSIDVTNLNTIYATALITTKTGTCDADIIVYNKSNPTSHSDGRLSYVPFTSIGVNNMWLDVSSLTGNVWIAIAVAKGSSAAGAIDAKFYEVWAE